MKKCNVEGCDEKQRRYGYCNKHSVRYKKHGDPLIVKKPNYKNRKKTTKKIRLCSLDGCNKIHCALGYCQKHYYRYKKHGDPNFTLFNKNGSGYVDGNIRYIYKPNHPNSFKNGRIQEHVYIMSENINRPINKDEKVIHKNGDKLDNRLENLELHKVSDICSVYRCFGKVRSKGYCSKHYTRFLKFKDPLKMLIAENGAGSINEYGYRLVYKPDHPNAQVGGRILEHRFVMSEKIGRPLRKFEYVHHKNGIRHDNRPENLEIWVSRHPPGQTPEDLVKWAKDILDMYEEEIEKNSM